MRNDKEAPITYQSTGVNYDAMDPLKRMAQLKGRETAKNINVSGYREVEASRGESAYIWEEEDKYGAMVIEGLGTKNIVADEMRKITGKTYHQEIAQDDVAMIVNDLITVGGRPLVVGAYFAAGQSQWFEDRAKMEDLTDGFRNACNMAGAVWGGGESPTLKGIILDGQADLAGAAVGEIKPKERLTLGQKLAAGDSILLVESSGIHANGLTLARTIAARLPNGYATPLSDGTMYGEALLASTPIYARLVDDLFENGVDVHYMVNITGHGWRKLMRANRPFSYIINEIPEPQPLFRFIQEHSGNDDMEMYGNLNMGAGFAVILPEADVQKAQEIALDAHGFKTWKAGEVVDKCVVIKPRNLVYGGKTLGVR